MVEIVVILCFVWLLCKIGGSDTFEKLDSRSSADKYYKKELEPGWKAEREDLVRQWKAEAEAIKRSSQD